MGRQAVYTRHSVYTIHSVYTRGPGRGPFLGPFGAPGVYGRVSHCGLSRTCPPGGCTGPNFPRTTDLEAYGEPGPNGNSERKGKDSDEKKKKGDCYNWLNDGHCARDKSCKFHHDKSQRESRQKQSEITSTSSRSSTTSSESPVPPKGMGGLPSDRPVPYNYCGVEDSPTFSLKATTLPSRAKMIEFCCSWVVVQ